MFIIFLFQICCVFYLRHWNDKRGVHFFMLRILVTKIISALTQQQKFKFWYHYLIREIFPRQRKENKVHTFRHERGLTDDSTSNPQEFSEALHSIVIPNTGVTLCVSHPNYSPDLHIESQICPITCPRRQTDYIKNSFLFLLPDVEDLQFGLKLGLLAVISRLLFYSHSVSCFYLTAII